MLSLVLDDLIEMMRAGRILYVGHGCNCQCRMASGFAAGIREHFFAAVEIDLKTEPGDRSKMGRFTSAVIPNNSMQIFNMYTQFYYGNPSQKNFDIEAYERALTSVLITIPEGATLYIPAIGAGLGGGDIHEILEVTERVAKPLLRDVTMVIRHDSPFKRLVEEWKPTL